MCVCVCVNINMTQVVKSGIMERDHGDDNCEVIVMNEAGCSGCSNSNDSFNNFTKQERLEISQCTDEMKAVDGIETQYYNSFESEKRLVGDPAYIGWLTKKKKKRSRDHIVDDDESNVIIKKKNCVGAEVIDVCDNDVGDDTDDMLSIRSPSPSLIEPSQNNDRYGKIKN